MKISSYFVAAAIAGVAFSSLAAEEINQEQAMGRQSIGQVSVSGLPGSTDDVARALARKAEEEDAAYFRIIGIDNSGDSSMWSGDAQLYR